MKLMAATLEDREEHRHCPKDDILHAEYELSHRDKTYKIKDKIGRGGFGQIYSAVDVENGESVAVKVEAESMDRDSLTMEQHVYRQCQGGAHIPKLYDHGTLMIANKFYRWIVLELLGKNLSELRRLCQSEGRHTMSPNTTFRVALQAIDALKHVHACGFVHRDIKPSNLCLGRCRQTLRLLYIIDFGLARKWNAELEERSRPGFRGTVRYASINAHKGRDLSGADDLTNLWYMMVEMIQGELPWRRTREKDLVGQIKQAVTPHKLLRDLDALTMSKLTEYYQQNESVGFLDTPNYSRLKIILAEGIDKNLKLDWECIFV